MSRIVKVKTIIMAGGKGTRIAGLYPELPKPMIPIAGKPILEYQIKVLKKQGYCDIILVIGHLGRVIRNYFKDGSAFGVHINYLEERKPLGTAGALGLLKNEIKEDFLLLNGDLIFDVDLERFYQYHRKQKGWATVLTHPNNHPYDSGLIAVKEGKVVHWLHKEEKRKWNKNRVNAGLHILSPEAVKNISGDEKKDLDRDILKPMIEKGKLFAYDSPEYVKDMGTPERLNETEKDICSGQVEAKNLKIKQKAIFLDRDGTLNIYRGFIRKHEELELITGITKAIKLINRSGYLAIVVTNQPVVARGEVTEKELEEIHNKLETLLGREGAYLDAIYYCPHHPDNGFEGERKELKIECECRKPKPGLFYQAAKDFNIDLSKSFMIGDSSIDMEAGEKAGCRTYLVNRNERNGLLKIVEGICNSFPSCFI